jgi:HSP20 family protein
MASEKQSKEVDILRPGSLLQEFGRPWDLLSRYFESTFPERMRSGAMTAPAVDVSEDEARYLVTAELPGVKKEDVCIEVEENVLSIRGEKRSEREETKDRTHFVERSYGAFHRSFTLPSNADLDQIKASVEDGVLSVEIPKKEESKPRTVTVT